MLETQITSTGERYIYTQRKEKFNVTYSQLHCWNSHEFFVNCDIFTTRRVYSGTDYLQNVIKPFYYFSLLNRLQHFTKNFRHTLHKASIQCNLYSF